MKNMTGMKMMCASVALAAFAMGSTALAALSDGEIAEIVKTANDAEIDAGKLAQRKADNAQVKEFAKRMVSAHEDNTKEGKKIFKDSDIKMKNNDEAKMLKKDAKAKLSTLKDKKGKDFDVAYINSQVDMHQMVLNDLDQKLIPAAQKPQMKEFLQKTREHVQEHLTKAQEIQTTLQR